MIFIQLIAFIGLVAGGFMLFKITPSEFAGELFDRFTSDPDSLKSRINEYTGRKKQNFIKRELSDVQEILRITNRSGAFGLLCTASVFFSAAGVCIAILIENFFLLPVLAAGLLFIPFWYIRLTSVSFKAEINSELETAMSIITTAYLRSEDIITSVEENVNYLNPPIKQIFEGFISKVRYAKPDVAGALRSMKTGVDNAVFHEWLETLVSCQHDRSLKSTLNAIVAKLSDMRVVNAELQYMIVAPRKEFLTMAALVLASPPFIYVLNKSWFDSLMNTPVGQIALSVAAALVFISAGFVIKLTKPIEYRR